jgi:hypothetical protein
MNPSERFKEYLSTTPTRHYGACEAQLNEAINEIDELTADLARAMAVVEAARDLLGCPYTLDEASIPSAGIDAAPDQVVGVISVALPRYRRIRATIAAFDAAKEKS